MSHGVQSINEIVGSIAGEARGGFSSPILNPDDGGSRAQSCNHARGDGAELLASAAVGSKPFHDLTVSAGRR